MTYLQRTIKRNLAHNTLHKSRLTFTILTDESHFLTSFDNQVDPLKHRLTWSITMQSIGISLP